MRKCLAAVGFLSTLAVLNQHVSAAMVTVDTVATADTFVRQDVPTTSYGSRGGLSVAGASTRNGAGDPVGLADTFLRFDLTSAVAALDAHFGGHNWTITDVALRVVESAAPANNDFGRGRGQFEARWIAADNWDETTLTWDDAGSHLNAALDVPVGTFTNLFEGDQFTPIQRFGLVLAESLVTDIRAGGNVSLYLTAVSESIGFTFNSRDITGTRPKPFLEVSAVPEPGTMVLLAAALPLLAARPRKRRRR